MNTFIFTILLSVSQLGNALLSLLRQKDKNDTNHTKIIPQIPTFINGTRLDFCYWNSDLGNDNPIELEFGNESVIANYWIENLPLKVITHGWLASDENCSGVFAIKTAYVNVGGYNVISVDWSSIGSNIVYPAPAILTDSVGYVLATFLDHVIDITGIHPSDIHLIGHSLGAHVSGSCGSHLKSGKIGRITGLDPAAPGFQFLLIPKGRLSEDDAEFVDVIHTAAGTLGYSDPMGHVDFFPNGGKAPQPGCGSIFSLLDYITCSHSRSYELYADSVNNRRSLIGIYCPSWINFLQLKCVNNTKIQMGHDVLTSARGLFFGKTNSVEPFGIF